ncbi:hypothetical protein K443DRAFT_681993 [Laccaria amethystina LaAM-08-1]|uniref:Fe2OG dioxygenase domain-containing protein n=1 Tax=Laccaria amethystina LaAM-08-1 TaxID=1095629 RepID=A0A0C9WW67_9AGAR|nr:hypothetical protein K443DRAFT_681993 [Laccaria amethystina LaAM-08-1]
MATIIPIDFSQTPLATSYSPFYAKILDNVFSPKECADLIALASSAGDWSPAGLSAEGPTETVHTNFRNSDRVLVINDEVSSRIYEKLRPLVDEICEIAPRSRWSCITTRPGREKGPTWKMVRINPRLSFLRYGPGQYFKPHCDGLNDLLDGKQKSFVTLHLYLNESESLTGGATRFWTPDKKEHLDVEPKLGRVLVFQQRMLVHSGEEVTGGVKYTMRSDFMFEQASS